MEPNLLATNVPVRLAKIRLRGQGNRVKKCVTSR
jgi:hypothetical protein